jgi:hypothetical protein
MLAAIHELRSVLANGCGAGWFSIRMRAWPANWK